MDLASRLPSAASPAALGPIDFANVLRAMAAELESQHERNTKTAWQPVEARGLAKELHGLAERADTVAVEKEKAGTAVVTEMAGQAAVDASATRAAGPDGENAKIVAAAGEAVAKAEPLKLEEDDGVWRDKNGAALESALEADPEHGDSPVRLVDARYIVELSKRGGKIVRRQELPEEAFIGLDTLKRLDEGNGGCLRVIAISHPWQQPDHPGNGAHTLPTNSPTNSLDSRGSLLLLCAHFRPDPKEVNLTLLAKVLERFIAYGNTYAVFFDFMSLFQKGPDGTRTDVEVALFGKALSNMMVWYAHPKTMTFKLTALPVGYPEGFVFPEGMEPNKAGYFDR